MTPASHHLFVNNLQHELAVAHIPAPSCEDTSTELCPQLSLANDRHRLVVPKYNPARTFTPEGSVGIGGSYMCIYPMDSPGGYQLIGQTLPIWNTFGRAGPFTPQKPWLLRNFDQVRPPNCLAQS